MTAPVTTAAPFPRMIEGSAGTMVFGNGVYAIQGEITDVGDDYVILSGRDSQARVDNAPAQIYAVPVASIVYWRYEADD